MRAKQYILAILFVGIVVPLGSIFLFNLILDPHHLWHQDFRTDPLELDPSARISKAYEVRRLRPKHIVIGSSRCFMGIRMDHEAWPEGLRYNLAVSGATTEEYLAYFLHAQGVQALDTVVFGLDFFSFNAERPRKLSKYEHVLHYRDKQFGWQIERLKITSSASTVVDSYRAYQTRKKGPEELLRKYRALAEKVLGPGAIRSTFEKAVKGSASYLYFGGNSYGFSFEKAGEASTLDFYHDIVAFCYTNEIDLKLFISPVHAVQMEVIDTIRLWDDFEEWKRRITNINEQTAHQLGQPPFTLWDFSGYNSITSESIPPPHDKIEIMKYFFDASHYSIRTGDLILDTLFNKSRTPDFGTALTTDTIEEVLAGIREDRAEWRESNPFDFMAFRALAKKHSPKKWRRAPSRASNQ